MGFFPETEMVVFTKPSTSVAHEKSIDNLLTMIKTVKINSCSFIN